MVPTWRVRPPGSRLNHKHPVSRRLAGFWAMNEGAYGLAYDLSPFGNHGTYSSFTAPFDPSHHGGEAPHFNLSSSFIDMGTPGPASLDITGPISVCAWVNRSAGAAFDEMIVSKGFNGTNTQYQLFYDRTTNKVTFNTYNGTPHGASSTTSSSLNIWEFWVGTFDGALWKIYRNGVLEATTADSQAPAQTARGVNIGANDNSTGRSNWWGGGIDGVRIYARALDAEEAAWLFVDPYAGLFPNHDDALAILSGGGGGGGTSQIFRSPVFNSRAIGAH